MLPRLFGVFGLVFGLAYVNEGVSFLPVAFHAYWHRLLGRFLVFSAYICLDLFFGTALVIAAFGLLFATEWARKLWLMVTPALIVVHLTVILLGEILQRETTNFYLVWTSMLVLVTVLSWWKLQPPDTNARS